MEIAGGCRCGNIRFALAWPDDARIPARACQCDWCTARGATWTSHPDARLVVSIQARAQVDQVRFGTGTADFHVCRTCGDAVFVACEMDGRDYAVVNVGMFEDVDPALLDRSDSDVEGETLDARLARRRARWIGDVRING